MVVVTPWPEPFLVGVLMVLFLLSMVGVLDDVRAEGCGTLDKAGPNGVCAPPAPDRIDLNRRFDLADSYSSTPTTPRQSTVLTERA